MFQDADWLELASVQAPFPPQPRRVAPVYEQRCSDDEFEAVYYGEQGKWM